MSATTLPVFVSYSRQNADLRERLSNDLVERGYRVWVDLQQIHGGDAWEELVEEAIESCGVLLVIVTADSRKSANVRREWLYARECGKPIIPLRFEPVRMPIGLVELSYISDFESDYGAGLNKLLTDLRYYARSAVPISELDPTLFPIDPKAKDTKALMSPAEDDVRGGQADE